MTHTPPSTIAQLLFASAPSKPFSALVRDLDAALARVGGDRRITWDHDDMVFLDMDGTRVGMAIAETLDSGHAACLTISVGAVPGSADTTDPERHAKLCERIAARVEQSLGAIQVLWHRVEEPVTVDLVDALTDALPRLTQPAAAPEPVTEDLVDRLLDSHPFPEKTTNVARKAALRTNAASNRTSEPLAEAELVILPRAADHPAQEPAAPAKTAPDRASRKRRQPRETAAEKRRRGSSELAGLRDALYETAETEESGTNAQRIAAMTMNATLTIVMPPVGATLIASAWRQGVDLRTSARAMAITGSLFAFTQAAAAADLVTKLPF